MEGNVIRFEGSSLVMETTPLQTEALAIWMGLKEASSLYTRVEVLIDNEDMVRALRDPRNASKEIHTMVKDNLDVVSHFNYF